MDHLSRSLNFLNLIIATKGLPVKTRLIAAILICFACMNVPPSPLKADETETKQRVRDNPERQQKRQSDKPRGDRERIKRQKGQPGIRDGKQQRRTGGPEKLMKLIRSLPVLRALDADHDGTISESEISNATAALQTIDQNGDGQLTFEELRPPMKRGRGGPESGPDRVKWLERQFDQLDQNSDGQLSQDEARGPLKKQFSKIDANGDGTVSKLELAEAGKIMGERRKKFPGGREPKSAPGGDKPRRPPVE